MNSLLSFVQLHIHSLQIGLLLYWEAVTYVCCEVAVKYAALYGSSLYDPLSSPYTYTSPPTFGDAGLLQQPSEDYREWRDRVGLAP